MANKQNTPCFDATTICAKQKKVKGVKTSSRDRAIGSRGSESPTRDTSTPSNSPKHPRTEGGMATGEIRNSITPIPHTSGLPNPAIPLIGNSTHPLPSPGLVSFDVFDPLLKDANRFIKELDGDARMPITSIYD